MGNDTIVAHRSGQTGRASDWGKAVLAKDLPSGLCERFLADPDYFFDHDPERGLLKQDAATTVIDVHEDGGRFVLKRYNARGRWHTVKRALRRSRARRCWEMAQAFQLAGIRTASPLGYAERRYGPLRGNSYLIYPFIDGYQSMTWLPAQSEGMWEQFIAALNRVFTRMAEHRLSHGDMKATNIYWHRDDIWLIDLDSARKHRLGYLAKRAQRRDRHRFLRNWGVSPGLKIFARDRLINL